MIQNMLIYLGLGIAATTLAAILWSIALPKKRLWPPKNYTTFTPFFVWVPTFALFGILILLGILGWGEIGLPNWLRLGFGVPLVLIGNTVVWIEASKFGISQTGGAKGSLRMEGMYRYSRNPQYVADIAMICGWIMLSASLWTMVVGLASITVLIAAPFAEEPWLKIQYGAEFDSYTARVRRFF